MVRCLDGLKHLCAAIVDCCGTDLYNQPKGLQDPEALARETVCMLPSLLNFPVLDVRKPVWEHYVMGESHWLVVSFNYIVNFEQLILFYKFQFNDRKDVT
jgi:hypothetical protein